MTNYKVKFTWTTSCLWHDGTYSFEEAESFCKLFKMNMVLDYQKKTITIS